MRLFTPVLLAALALAGSPAANAQTPFLVTGTFTPSYGGASSVGESYQIDVGFSSIADTSPTSNYTFNYDGSVLTSQTPGLTITSSSAGTYQLDTVLPTGADGEDVAYLSQSIDGTPGEVAFSAGTPSTQATEDFEPACSLDTEGFSSGAAPFTLTFIGVVVPEIDGRAAAPPFAICAGLFMLAADRRRKVRSSKA